MEETRTITIGRLGGLGDGVGECDGLPVYVPFTLPGEVVRVAFSRTSKKGIRAQLVEVLEPSPEREAPRCPHFTACGGCYLQHLPDSLYVAFKEQTLRAAVERAGFDSSRVGAMFKVGERARRRVRFQVGTAGGKVGIGFFGRRSHELIDIEKCAVITERIENLLAPLRELLGELESASEVGNLIVCDAGGGSEITVTAARLPGSNDMEALSAFCKEHYVSRTCWDAWEKCLVTFQAGRPAIEIGGYAVGIPARGAFIQPTAAGQAKLTEIVLEEVGEGMNVADLYSGLGTFSFPLLESNCSVHAYEGSGAMADAVREAVSRFRLHDGIRMTQRDLFGEPVRAEELAGFDAVVIDPPRSGAEPQVRELAAGCLPLVILISCNPLALERDAAHLRAAGYRLERAEAIDQFPWSTHLESIAVFRK